MTDKHPGARMVGESYKDHSARAFGMLRATEVDLAEARAELLRRADLCQLFAEHISAVRVALDVTEDADCSGPDSADVRVIERLRHDLDAARRTVADYVAHVEDGDRFNALADLVRRAA